MFTRGYTKVNKNDASIHDDEISNPINNPMLNVELASIDASPSAIPVTITSNQFTIKVLYKERVYEIAGLTNDTSITMLKQKIETATEVPSHRQRLILTGKLLKPDDKPLSFFKIVANTSVHLFPIPEATAAAVAPPPMATNATPTADVVGTYNSLFRTDPSLPPQTLRNVYYDMALEQTVREVRLWCFVLVSLSVMELFLNFNYFAATGNIGNTTLDAILFVFDTVCSIGGVWVGSLGMKSLRTMDIVDIRKYVQWLGILALGCIILRVIWFADVIVRVKQAVKDSEANANNSTTNNNNNNQNNNNNMNDDHPQEQLDDRAVFTFGVQAFIIATICIGAWISCFRRALRLHVAVLLQPNQQSTASATAPAAAATGGESIPMAQATNPMTANISV